MPYDSLKDAGPSFIFEPVPDDKPDPKRVVIEKVKVRIKETYPNPSHAGAYGEIEEIDGTRQWFYIHLNGDPERTLIKLRCYEFDVLNCGTGAAA